MTTNANGPVTIGPEVAKVAADCQSSPKLSPSATSSAECPGCCANVNERGECLIEGLCPRCRRARDLRVERWHNCGLGARHRRLRTWNQLEPPALGWSRWYAAENELKKFVVDPQGAMLVLLGARGSGKTQLIAVAVSETIGTGRSAVYVTVPELLADLKRRYGTGDRNDPGPHDGDAGWLAHWGAPYLLCIDEIAERIDSAWSETMLAALLDRRYRELRPTILTGNVKKDDLGKVLPASICSRINERGGVVVCDWSSFREERP